MINLLQVTKTYSTGKSVIHALQGLDFKVGEGDLTVIRGPSGSGKSTLLNILGLLDDPTTGEVRLFDKPVSYTDYDLLAYQRSMVLSFIFQSFNLNPVLTLEENIMVPLMIRSDITKKEKIKRVDEWVSKVGLDQHKHHKPEELSGGQRQRVAIARAMVSYPKIVIADEPTANLDSKTARNIIDLMRELNHTEKTAFVFATHDPLLDEFAKNIFLMKDGKLVQ